MAIANKKLKWSLSEFDAENEMMIEFLRFIVIELLEEAPLAKLFLFLIEKIISSGENPRTVVRKGAAIYF